MSCEKFYNSNMKNINSSLVTGELFLDLEAVIHGKTSPTLQTIFALNEILELLVLKNSLFMTSSDHILVIKNLNRAEIEKLGGSEQIDWSYEIRNLGSANLLKPMITTHLYDTGILILDTEQDDDSEFRNFGQEIFKQQWKSGNWLLKTIGYDTPNLQQKEFYEAAFLQGFHNTYQRVSSDPVYWKMVITAWPHAAEDFKTIGYDFEFMYKYYKQVGAYLDFAKHKNYDFNDSPFMQPFIALQVQPSDLFSKVFYEELKNTREHEVKNILELNEPWVLFLPPLTTILLQRCNRIEDLPMEMIKLRNEFQNIRESFSSFQKDFNDAKLIKEKIELKKDFLHSIELFRSKVTAPKKRFVKTVLDFTADHSVNALANDFSGPVKSIVQKISEFVYQKKICPWVCSFADLYEKSLDIDVNSNLIEKVFGEVNLDNLDYYKSFGKVSASLTGGKLK